MANLDLKHWSKLAAIHTLAILHHNAIDDEVFIGVLQLVVDEINSVASFSMDGMDYNVRIMTFIGDSPASAAIGWNIINF